jgi:AcrR family transcriptional regulator
MVEGIGETLDPRIRRTRRLLQQALGKLLESKEFEKISVQDIADAATVNRATFYDHYADKFALLECLVASRFQELLAERDVQFDGTCPSALKAMVLAVCDYLVRMQGPNSQRQLDPHMERAIVAVVRGMLLDGLKRHVPERAVAPEMIAAAASWAIYGAAKEWVRTPGRCASDEIADTVTLLVAPFFGVTGGPPARSTG